MPERRPRHKRDWLPWAWLGSGLLVVWSGIAIAVVLLHREQTEGAVGAFFGAAAVGFALCVSGLDYLQGKLLDAYLEAARSVQLR